VSSSSLSLSLSCLSRGNASKMVVAWIGFGADVSSVRIELHRSIRQRCSISKAITTRKPELTSDSRSVRPNQRVKFAKREVLLAASVKDERESFRVETAPIEGQKTGTSGLRKPTSVLLDEPKFVPNWIQSLFDAIGQDEIRSNPVIVLGGDGRFYNSHAAQIIIRMAKANGFQRVIVGRDAILSTPAASAVIRARGALGGVVLTASHNEAGLKGDWGVKYNTQHGGPATETLTDRVYDITTTISRFYIDGTLPPVDLTACAELEIDSATTSAAGDSKFVVEVVDPVEEYAAVLRRVFDFDALKKFVSSSQVRVIFDAMNAVTSEYAQRILVDELGLSPESLLNCSPLEDFGGKHPDPNLTYATQLVAAMGLNPDGTPSSIDQVRAAPDLGAASDGDGDRNMILGRGIFVSPADSIAIIADYAERCIPFFLEGGVRGVARSMPTSAALDRVAAKRGWTCFETPTGWKYFGNLMDAGLITLCGEESFGTSGSHIREKDGLWAVLAWMSILAFRNKDGARAGDDVESNRWVSVEKIVHEHWFTYGRNYYGRHDYEKVDARAAEQVMERLRSRIDANAADAAQEEYVIDEFEYEDPVDHSVARKQGVRVLFEDGSRVVFRLSGTGSSGATIRIYLEKFESPRQVDEDEQTASSRLLQTARHALQPLANAALELGDVQNLTGRDAPDVIT